MNQLRKQCAVCESRVQTNVILKWQRDSDQKQFWICALCAEDGKVNADSVKIFTNHSFSTLVYPRKG